MVDSSTILLVDDEESVRTLLTFPLERDGYTVVQAADGEEALDRFEAQPVDLVVLDIMLPKLDGLEVCKRLRATSTVPIIMLTARDDELDKVLGLELGADDYITKPFSIREFRSRVKALLRRARTPWHDDAVERGADRRRRPPDRRAAPHGRGAGERAQLTYVEFELLRTLMAHPGAGLQSTHVARGAVGHGGLPRPAHDRRPHPAPAREDRGRLAPARDDPHGAQRRLPLPGHVNPLLA